MGPGFVWGIWDGNPPVRSNAKGLIAGMGLEFSRLGSRSQGVSRSCFGSLGLEALCSWSCFHDSILAVSCMKKAAVAVKKIDFYVVQKEHHGRIVIGEKKTAISRGRSSK